MRYRGADGLQALRLMTEHHTSEHRIRRVVVLSQDGCRHALQPDTSNIELHHML
jgi:hypothetical protein